MLKSQSTTVENHQKCYNKYITKCKIYQLKCLKLIQLTTSISLFEIIHYYLYIVDSQMVSNYPWPDDLPELVPPILSYTKPRNISVTNPI